MATEDAQRDESREDQIAERVAEKLEERDVEGRQPTPHGRRVSLIVFGAALLVASVLLLIASIQLGGVWTVIGSLMVALALLLVAGYPVIGSALMRLRAETEATREARREVRTVRREDAQSSEVVSKTNPS